MKWRTIIWSRTRLQDISTAIFLMLAIFSSTSTGSEGNRGSIKNLQSIKNGVNEASGLQPVSKSPNLERDRGSSSVENNTDNGPALTSFLKNVLRAQNELKWIDQAVRRVDAKETHEKIPARYLRASLRPVSRYRTKIRFKRRSGRRHDENEPRPSSKRKYYQDENPERIYLDDEMKVKRYANPSTEYDEEGYSPSRRKQQRSAVDDEQPVDDSTLKHWAKEEGLQIPRSWFDSGQISRKSDDTSVNHWPNGDNGEEEREIRGLNRVDDFSRSVDDWVENPRDERDARKPSVRSLGRKEAEEPSLESLKKTVLELRKSLEDSDKKMDQLNEKEVVFSVAKNRERHVEDISGKKEGRAKGEHERAMPALMNTAKTLRNKKHSNAEYEESDREYQHSPSRESNWWDDPRSAADMFDFKRRIDDADDEDDDEYFEPGNSEFDYVMRRVKREKDDDDDGEEKKERIRVYRRAGFGELYPEENPREEDAEEGDKAVRIYREIREPGPDNINNDRNFDAVENGERKSPDINVNKNGQFSSEEFKEIKNVSDDNLVEKSGSSTSPENGPREKTTGTIGNLNLKEEKKPGFLSADEKRSLSLRGRRKEENEQRLSDDDSNPKSIKSRVDELPKTAPMKSLAEIISHEKKTTDITERKKEVEKSEPNEDDVHKLTQDSNEAKKHEEQEKKDTCQEPNDVEKSLDHIESLEGKKNDDKQEGTRSEDGIIKVHEAKLAVAATAERMTDDTDLKNELENEDKLDPQELKNTRNEKDLNSGDKINPDSSKEAKNRDSNTVRLAESETSSNSNIVTRNSQSQNDTKIENESTTKSEESTETLYSGYNDKQNSSQYENVENEILETNHEKGDPKIEDLDRHNFDTEIKGPVLKREETKRKLLWLSEKSTANEESKDSEIRDGRRDLGWDQNRGEKSVQRPANLLKSSIKNREYGLKFLKRSLKVAKDDPVDRGSRRLKNRNSFRSMKKEVGKRSMQKIRERQKEPDVEEDAYEVEDDGVARNDEDFKENDGEENQSLGSDGRYRSSSIRLLSHGKRDRDPMRDRINMLIKQKLDDREKGGKFTHFKREANQPAANIQYYDYDSDVNGGDSDADSTIVENDQQILERQNFTEPEVITDKAPPETITKKDENAEEERKQESEREQQSTKQPKEEFISDVELSKSEKKKPPSYHRLNEEEFKNNLQEDESNSEINERRENEAVKSSTRWLGQPGETENDSTDREDRYQNFRDSEEREKIPENEKEEVLEEPLEYSVNVHGKLDPESIDAMLSEKGNTKEKEFGEAEKRNEKSEIGNDEDWKYEKTISKSRPRDDDRIDDDEFEKEDSPQSSGRNWRYRDSARIEEGNNDRSSSRYYFSHNGNNRDKIIDNQNVSSREARPTEEFNRDSLPTMLDPGGTRSLAPGERTYLVISPKKMQCPRKPSDENSSSSGSNYLALKITDDMFKGGIEQSNPIDDKTAENNLMGKTTTEWKVIGMGDNARNNPSSLHDDKLISSQNLATNQRGVVKESILDPEEKVEYFYEETSPRFGRDLKYVRESHRSFGRSLQSVSYPTDPFERVNRKVDFDGGEKPVDKYLENTQKGYKNFETVDNSVKKKSATSERKETGESETVESLDLKRSMIKPDKENFTNVVNKNNFEKRSSELETKDNETEIDKDKRGMTNVEEWEMNTPTVQKQHLISAAKNMVNYPQNLAEKNNLQLASTPKISPNFYDSVTSGSHERESRSVKLNDENFKSYPPVRAELLSTNKKRSKIRRKTKSRNKFRPSNSPSRSNRFSKNVHSPWKSNSKNMRLDYNQDSKGFNPDDNIVGIHNGLKSDDYSRPNHSRRKSVKENESNHRHYQNSDLKKERNKMSRSEKIRPHESMESQLDLTDSKTPLKSVKSHKKRHFKDIVRNPVIQHAKSHNKITAGSMSHSHSSTLHGKSFEAAEGYDAGSSPEGDKKVLDENAEDPALQKVKPELDDPQKKKFTVLLAADNMEDESQMDLALHGELAGKIVERIFDQVQKNDALKVALGPGLFRKHKSEDAVATDKIYRQGLDEDEVKHTEGMMRRVMELLGRLILDEVQRKTCASLPPDMREFLQWMLGVENEERSSDQVPPLPFVHNQEPDHRQGDKFLFEDPSRHEVTGDIDELYKKVRLLKGLINEYNSLTDKEKTKVQTVHDYLEKQLSLLLNYIEKKEAMGQKTPPEGGNILQYQNAVPNLNGTVVPESTLSPLVNTPSILMLSNASFVEPPRDSKHFLRFRRNENRRNSEGEVETEPKRRKHRKHKRPNTEKHDRRKSHKRKHKKKKKKKKKNHQHDNDRDAQSPEYKKLIRRATMLRKKRANIYEDNWDPVDSGYEEPTIYTSNGKLTNERRRSFSRNKFDHENEDVKKPTDPYFWSNALSGELELEKNPFSDELDLETEQLGDTIDDRDGDSPKNPNVDTKITRNFETRLDSIAENPKNKRNVFNAAEKTGAKKPNSEMQVKRDVLSASVALQPWLNPKSNDLVSSDYLKKLTNELVHGSQVPPIYPVGRVYEEKKRDVEMSEGRNIADDEVMLLSKREAWKTQNEQQLEEVAFGKDMRGKLREKEQFEKLTGIDRRKNPGDDNRRRKREGDEKNSTTKTGDDFDEKKSETEGNVKTVENMENEIRNETVIDNYVISTENTTTKTTDEPPIKKKVDERAESKATNLKNHQNPVDKKIVEGSKYVVKSISNKDEKATNLNTEIEKRSSKNNEFFDDLKTDANKENGKKLDPTPFLESKKVIEKRDNRRSSTLAIHEVEGSAILPLLEVSEQREQQKQASKTEKDDQRDIADQMLGYESPLTGILNTY